MLLDVELYGYLAFSHSPAGPFLDFAASHHQAMMVDLTDISDEQQGSPLDRYITSYAAGAASTAKVDTLSEVSVCPCCGAHDL